MEAEAARVQAEKAAQKKREKKERVQAENAAKVAKWKRRRDVIEAKKAAMKADRDRAKKDKGEGKGKRKSKRKDKGKGKGEVPVLSNARIEPQEDAEMRRSTQRRLGVAMAAMTSC